LFSIDSSYVKPRFNATKYPITTPIIVVQSALILNAELVLVALATTAALTITTTYVELVRILTRLGKKLKLIVIVVSIFRASSLALASNAFINENNNNFRCSSSSSISSSINNSNSLPIIM